MGVIAACQLKKESGESTQKITIAVAASVQFALKEVVKKFREETGIQCNIVPGSSGKLTAQIREGAPFDVFVSADIKYPNELFVNGISTRPPRIYGYGKLVLWTVKDGLTPSIDALSKNNVKHIALANPKTAPYGVASVEFLKNHNLFDRLEPKLVFGESISQVSQFLIIETAEIGFSAKSVILSPAMSGKGRWIELENDSYSPIAQAAIVIKKGESKNIEIAEKFFRFLFSEKAKIILEAYGYTVPGPNEPMNQ